MKDETLSCRLRALNLQFKDLQLPLTALTHRSYSHEAVTLVESNERLEFLGDALLSAVVADMLMCEYPDLREGALSRMRAALVSGSSLAQLAHTCQLGGHLRIGRGEEANGGRERVSILAGAFEALLGALYLEHGENGMQALRDFLLPLLRPLLPAARLEAQSKDARSRLQEWAQAEFGITPQYRTIAQEGPNHHLQFIVEVRLAEQEKAVGRGANKQAAARAAAGALLARHSPNSAPE